MGAPDMYTETTTTTSAPARKRRVKLRWILLGVGALAAVLIAVGLWLFFRGDAPEEVSLDAAVENLGLDADDSTEENDTGSGVENEPAETVDAGDATPVDDSSSEADAARISGEWIIDTESGEFDYETATGTFAGFRIEEELRTIGSTTAVGRTGDIIGSMTIDGTTVTAASFEIDLTTVTTNSEMRDDNVQDALETSTFPTAMFVLTEPIELGAEAATGAAVSVAATGEMTIHGVTQPIEFAMDAQLIDGLVVAVGTTTMTFSDYGVEVPDGGPVISVDDFGVVELQFLLRR